MVQRVDYDVVIVGAGLGGLASCIFLQRQPLGLRVACIEPERFPHARVGESFDWSTPGLLQALGLPRDQIVQEKMGTYKLNIRLMSLGRKEFFGKPRAWFRHKPLEFEITTLHGDRVQIDQRLFEKAQDLGTTFLWDQVTSVETEGERLVAVQTAENGRITANWFIDASGQAQVFSKALGIPKVEYGQRKVALWTYFNAPLDNEGTSFYGDNSEEYLSWIWEIPITPTTISVGYILPADQMQRRRKSGQSAEEILRSELSRHARFIPLIAEQPNFQVLICSYRSYEQKKVCGRNWLMVGEAASLPDPFTANGVTAAFRHAQDAVDFIQASLRRGSLSRRQRYVYSSHVRKIGHAFNHSIESSAYEWPMRWGLGEKGAEQVYTIFSYSINAFYTKWRPQSYVGLAAWNVLLDIVHVWMNFWSMVGRLNFQLRLKRRPQRAATVGAPPPTFSEKQPFGK